jgi:LPXTG-site transpeptidase (sortase) family protein
VSSAHSATRRRFLAGLSATTLLAACGTPAPAATPTSAAPALAATVAAMGREAAGPAGPGGTPVAGGALPPSADIAAGLPTPTPTLIPPKPTVTPTPRPVVPTATPSAAPQTIEIAKINVNAPVKPVGTKATGEMDEPEGPFDVAWFKGSPMPGDPGNAILTGHLDYRGNPPRTAVFWDLKKLVPGDEVVVRTARGPLTFKVESSALYERSNAPVEQILGWAMGKVITLITCEGQFIPGTPGDYTHRRVVRARLLT